MSKPRRRIRVPFRSSALWACALALGLAAPAVAHDGPDARNRVSFAVESSREVANDWVTATVGVSDEDSDSARLAARVNDKMTKALALAKKAKGVEVRSGGYQTYPRYSSKSAGANAISGWHASQDLVLESADVDAVSRLVGQLQESGLLLRSIAFSVSPKRSRELEGELIDAAIAAFQARAKRVVAGLRARDYQVVALSIQTPQDGGPRPYLRAEAMSMKAAAPALESGDSTLTVRIDATIELER